MSILIGSRAGVYRLSLSTPSNPELVLDDVEVYDLAGSADALYAATAEGLYRSVDHSATWTKVPLPIETVAAVVGSPDGSRVYAGTMPARVFESRDGEIWTEQDGFRALSSRSKWYNRDVAVHVRSLAVHDDAPARVVAGIDGGGVHVSDDYGETWEERLTGVPQYVHEVLVCAADDFVAVTDAGLFKTRDAGRWWDFLHDDDLKHRYFRGAVRHGRTVYAGGARSHPPTWWREGSADAALYRVDFSVDDRRPRMTTVPYPGEPDELVLGGIDHDGRVIAGTNEGRILELTDTGAVETLATLPVQSEIRALYGL